MGGIGRKRVDELKEKGSGEGHNGRAAACTQQKIGEAPSMMVSSDAATFVSVSIPFDMVWLFVRVQDDIWTIRVG